jgi:hypothetical protein
MGEIFEFPLILLLFALGYFFNVNGKGHNVTHQLVGFCIGDA